jgi:hypothetical protein
MSKIQAALKEVARLLEQGPDLLSDGQADHVNLADFAVRYEDWYTRASLAVEVIAPDRLEDFRSAYRVDRRRDVSYDTYTISDYLTGMVVSRYGRPAFDTKSAFATKMLRQFAIVKAAASLAPSVLRDLRSTLQAELLDSDVAAARELAKAKHLRSAGVVCGVALEAHLSSVADRHNVKLLKKNPSIADWNEALKAASVIDVPTWRLIQRLADIRNLCGHKRDREPTASEVEDLIAGRGCPVFR